MNPLIEASLHTPEAFQGLLGSMDKNTASDLVSMYGGATPAIHAMRGLSFKHQQTLPGHIHTMLTDAEGEWDRGGKSERRTAPKLPALEFGYGDKVSSKDGQITGKVVQFRRYSKDEKAMMFGVSQDREPAIISTHPDSMLRKIAVGKKRRNYNEQSERKTMEDQAEVFEASRENFDLLVNEYGMSEDEALGFMAEHEGKSLDEFGPVAAVVGKTLLGAARLGARYAPKAFKAVAGWASKKGAAGMTSASGKALTGAQATARLYGKGAAGHAARKGVVKAAASTPVGKATIVGTTAAQLASMAYSGGGDDTAKKSGPKQGVASYGSRGRALRARMGKAPKTTGPKQDVVSYGVGGRAGTRKRDLARRGTAAPSAPAGSAHAATPPKGWLQAWNSMYKGGSGTGGGMSMGSAGEYTGPKKDTGFTPDNTPFTAGQLAAGKKRAGETSAAPAAKKSGDKRDMKAFNAAFNVARGNKEREFDFDGTVYHTRRGDDTEASYNAAMGGGSGGSKAAKTKPDAGTQVKNFIKDAPGSATQTKTQSGMFSGSDIKSLFNDPSFAKVPGGSPKMKMQSGGRKLAKGEMPSAARSVPKSTADTASTAIAKADPAAPLKATSAAVKSASQSNLDKQVGAFAAAETKNKSGGKVLKKTAKKVPASDVGTVLT